MLFIIGCIFSIIPYIKFVKNCLKQEKYYEIIGGDGLTLLLMALVGIAVLYVLIALSFDFAMFIRNGE